MKKSLHRFRIAKVSSQDGTHTGQSAAPSPISPIEERSRKNGQNACDRCRRLKRKCSKTYPTCTLCQNGGLECSFSGITEPQLSRTKQLEARVAWLSKYIDENLPSGSDSVTSKETGAEIVSRDNLIEPEPSSRDQRSSQREERSTGSDAPIVADETPMSVLSTREDATYGDMESTISTSRPSISTQRSVIDPRMSVTALVSQHQTTPQPLQRQSLELPGFSTRIAGKSVALRFSQAYFRHIHRSYPFMDQIKVMADMNRLEIEPHRLENIPTKLYILMAIGSTTLQRIGQVSEATVMNFNIIYEDVLRQCLLTDDVDSVETCLLLALYSLFDPTTVWPWKITGVLARQVVRMGLSRQAFAHEDLSIRQVEMRHRLFWSVWTLDRVVSTTLGLPFGITDENINVPLPGITLEEYSTSESAQHTLTLQINRHVIALRRLEEQILQRVHFTDSYKSTSLSPSDKRIIMQELRSKIENWYTHSCLVTPQERDTVPFHNTIPWLNFRYQNLLLLLYTPSNFNSLITDTHLKELQSCAQKYIQLSAVLFQHRHMPLNWVTLCRFVALCPVLLYCLVRGRKYDLKEELIMCAEMLEAFPARWDHAKRASVVLRRMATVNEPVSIPLTPSSYSQDGAQQPSALSLEDMCSLVGSLVRDMLGDSSIYTRAIDASVEVLQQHSSANGAGKFPGENIFDSIWTNDNILWSDAGDFAMGVI